MSNYIHPETGEVLSTKEEFLAALAVEEERLSEVYRVLGPLREAHAEHFPPAKLPSRVNRTEKQERIARCPRCGEKLA